MTTETLICPIKGKVVRGVSDGISVQITVSRITGNPVPLKTVTTEAWETEKAKMLASGYTLSDNEEKTVQVVFKHPVLQMLATRSRQLTDSKFKKGFIFSEAVIKSAKDMLANMATMNDVATFNTALKEYFGLVPRNYKNFILETAANADMIKDVVSRESELLDAYQSNTVTADDEADIYFEEATKEDYKAIEEALTRDRYRSTKVKNVYKVGTHSQDRRFTPNGKEVTLLFHGSRTENWFSIIKTGLKVDPVNVITTGKMYGSGIYFAPSIDKSAGYITNNGPGFIGVYEVVTGTPYVPKAYSGYFSLLTEAPKHKDCLWAHGGTNGLRHDEVIIYDESKCRLRYLLEV